MTRSGAIADKSAAAPGAHAEALEASRPSAVTAGPTWAGSASPGISLAGAVQCKCACGGEDGTCAACAGQQDMERMRRRPLDDSDQRETVADAGDLKSRLGGGAPLDPTLRAPMERAFDRDFSSVRMHTGDTAGDLARRYSARAFTIGDHIAFGRGQFHPASRAGRELIAHELTHVAQQQDARSGRGPSTGSYRALEAEANRAAPVAARGAPVASFSPAAPQVQRDDDDDDDQKTQGKSTINDEGLADVPAASMSANFYGLSFVPPGGSVLNLKTSWNRQMVAVALKRLLGTHYLPGHYEDEAISRFTLTPEGTYGPAAEEKARKENQTPPFTDFLFKARGALDVIRWLRNDKHEAVEIGQSQEEVLVLGQSLTDLRKDIDQAAADSDFKLPGWYTQTLFEMDINNFGDLLRSYSKLHDAGEEAGRRNVAADVLDAILPAINVLDAIRADQKLTSEPEYYLLWVPGKNIKDTPPAVASQDVAVKVNLMSQVLMFVRTQPAYMKVAQSQTADGAEARKELLKRSGRYLVSSVLLGGKGDQKLLSNPSIFNAKPFDANLSAYPELQPPMFDANVEANYDFTMHMGFHDVFDAMASYSYKFELIEVPPKDSLLTQGLTGTSGKKEDSPPKEPKTYKPGGVLWHKLSRDTHYNIADAKRIVHNMESSFGPAAIVALDLVLLNSLMRYLGTLISSFFDALLKPNYVAAFTFPHEGMYLVRCIARAHTSENAEIMRPPSVAYMPVWARNPQSVAEAQLQSEVDQDQADKDRLKEIDDLLADPKVEDRDALLAEKARIERQSTVEGSLTLAKEDLQKIIDDPATDESEKKNLKERIEKLDLILKMRKDRGLTGATKPERIHATFMGDKGQVVRLLMEAVDESGSDWPATHRKYHLYDSTTPDSGHSPGEATSTDEEQKKGDTARSKAIRIAIVSILESTMGYGRGYVATLIDGASNSDRVEADEKQIIMEGISNAATVLSVAVIAAAPSTGGASLSLLIPIGVLGAIPSAYRLISRAEAKNLRWDLNTAMDIVNIAGAACGLGGETAIAERSLFVGGALLITGIAAAGLGVVLMGVQVVEELKALEDLPPELRGPRAAEIIAGAMFQAGILVATILASHGRLQEKTGTAREGALARWKESLSDETKTQLKQDPDLFARFTEMPERVRELLTHCSDYCLPTKITRKQAGRIRDLLEKHSLTPADERMLKAYFADNRENLGGAIDQLESFKKVKDLRKFLGQEVAPADAVLLAFKNLRNDKDVRALVERIVKKGIFDVRQLGDVMDQVQSRGAGGERILGYIEELSNRNIPGADRVVSDLGKGYNFFRGAEWVLRWIDESGMWDAVKRFEVEAEPGGRRWDAQIGKNRFQFKNWNDFWKYSFLDQIIQDFKKSGGFKNFDVKWVFALTDSIKDAEALKGLMRDALDSALDKRPGFDQATVDAIKKALDRLVTVGVKK